VSHKIQPAHNLKSGQYDEREGKAMSKEDREKMASKLCEFWILEGEKRDFRLGFCSFLPNTHIMICKCEWISVLKCAKWAD